MLGSPEVQSLAYYFLQLYINSLPTFLGDCGFLFAKNVKMVFPRSNQATFSTLILPPGRGRGNGAYQTTPTNFHDSLLGIPPFSVFLRGRHEPPNAPGHRRPRPMGSLRHDLQRVSRLQRGCECSKTIAFRGPNIHLRNIQNNVYPALQCV